MNLGKIFTECTKAQIGPLSVVLLGVVENNSQCVALSRVNGADAVTKVGSVVVARAAHGSMMNCKDDRIALLWREHFNAGLPAWSLLGEDEFAAVKIFAALTQETGDLKRKHDVAV